MCREAEEVEGVLGVANKRPGTSWFTGSSCTLRSRTRLLDVELLEPNLSTKMERGG